MKCDAYFCVVLAQRFAWKYSIKLISDIDGWGISLWNCPQVIVTESHWWQVNIGSGKLLPEPMLTQICVAICCVSLGHNGLLLHEMKLIKTSLPMHSTTEVCRADSKLAPSQWEMLLQSNTISHWLGANLESARADSRLAPSQWETSLQSNAVSHWLGTNLESALGKAFHAITSVEPGWQKRFYFILCGYNCMYLSCPESDPDLANIS